MSSRIHRVIYDEGTIRDFGSADDASRFMEYLGTFGSKFTHTGLRYVGRKVYIVFEETEG